jgi:hypothetical protein
MRGGARVGAGRKRGGTNFAKQQAALMRKTPHTGRKRLAIDVLRKYMNEFAGLADAARNSADPSYTRWAKAAAEIAVQLAAFESPKLSAVARVMSEPGPLDFHLNIFERERVPAQIEHVPTATPPEIDTVATVAVEPEPPVEPLKPVEPEAPPTPTSPPDDKPAPPSWSQSRSLHQHPAMFGSWLRGSWRN